MKQKQNKVAIEQPGLRNGIKKEDILKLNDDEKDMIKDIRKYQSLSLTNKHAMECLLKSEQGYAAYVNIDIEIDKIIIDLFDTYEIKRNDMIELKKDLITKTHEGEVMTKPELELQIMKADLLIKQKILMLRNSCVKLHTFVNTKKLDMTVKLTEDDYNAKIEHIISKLKEISQTLY